ncbi:GMCL1 protein, partial [Polyodon spathula]|nr:GMCL1 protein [Polyodon spathula]
MGSLGSRLAGVGGPGSSQQSRHGCECRKRKRSSGCQCDSESEEDGDRLLNTPRRKKLKSTSRYIYQTLFLNGENSDIQICALGQEWNLHKVYLCQVSTACIHVSQWESYFHRCIVLFCFLILLFIPVPALQVVFGSLYRDDVLIKPSRVVMILAAACMLQLDGLIQQCGETMKETINVKTVCGYYSAAGTYGLDSVKKKCLEWLLNNLMTHQSVDLMKELSAGLMEQLIGSPDLFVMQVEMDVYTALKKWMFLQLVPSWSGPQKQLLADADSWISKKVKAFLQSEQGAVYAPVFRHIRLQYVINDLASAKIVERDAILHTDWLSAVYKQQWFAMLRTEHDNDFGPQDANKEEFEVSSMRCGRKLAKDGDYCWRWTGFNFGFDLLVTYSNRFIVFKRNTLSQPCGGSVSLQPRRNIAYRLRLASFDGSGKVICSRSTGYQVLALEKDQEYVVMNLDSRLLAFPLYICCNFLYISPASRRQESAEPESSSSIVS